MTSHAVAVMGTVLRSRWTGVAVGVLVLAATAARIGAAPFLHGLLSVRWPDVAVAVLLCAVATGASAWRWVAVARGFGVRLNGGVAVGMYYRSQLINSVLPGGVLGDVHRAVDHGRRTDRVGAAARAVAVERTAGQSVQLLMSAAVLAVLGISQSGTAIVLVVLAVALAAVLALALACLHPAARRVLAREARTLRSGLSSPAVVVQVVVASLIVLACWATTLVVSAAAVGVRIPLGEMVPLALVVLSAAALPVNVGGWGPREGAAAWAFASAGYGASAGVATATLFGVLSLLSLIPGALASGILPALRRRHLVRASLRGSQLRPVVGRLYRHGDAAPAHALQHDRLRTRG